ncbi:hypothetical protein CEXT_271691 [Caerostris extrusa]|uniref:Uncharacterized protein n=1 Tax=Caerostris extrusa TaxID=172846 RepID=A0AAV4N0B7_CAEEX|nr:hypothetical protein CEXT_271691 [Caerostris extrusa]
MSKLLTGNTSEILSVNHAPLAPSSDVTATFPPLPLCDGLIAAVKSDHSELDLGTNEEKWPSRISEK